MQFVSTRDSSNIVGFKSAILDSLPKDGGLYVPYKPEDLRKWILYADETTSFANLAGTLTSALINTEFSPIICEAIATRAFNFEPAVRQLDDKLFIMELDHGPTGSFRDFGVSYLISAMETLLQMEEEKAILLATSSGELGACLAHATRGKELVKTILLAPKGKLRGIRESDFVWNGGGIYPIEVDGSLQDCKDIVRKIFADRERVEKYHLTVANTANIGRLLPQAFFYTFAFSRIKKLVPGDIFYAMPAGNYGNIVSGLLSWQLSLPVNGFILPSTENLRTDARGNAIVMDSMVPLDKRTPVDPSDPSNLERLENTFKLSALMMRNFVYPADVTKKGTEDACRELFVKYKVFADRQTSAAYGAACMRREIVENDDGTVVLIARESPSLDGDFIKRNIGELPPTPDSIKEAFAPTTIDRPAIDRTDSESVLSVINSLNLRRIF
ncbi:MAG: pyridoxal-phosphate dependent enzyme [Treponema sp.]|nr:pyridoxal-phosphate dependent enzyme [Treponema sp.]MCR5621360.1 pyridoxal-phosphate dependent enzyme [Treponema sp.]